jgi:hypothetical protein
MGLYHKLLKHFEKRLDCAVGLGDLTFSIDASISSLPQLRATDLSEK